MTKHIYATLTLIFFQLSISFAQSDLCSGATSLTVNTTCINTSYNVSSGFAAEIASPSCYTATTSNFRDGYFSFTTGAGTTQVTITATTNRNLVLAVYSGACGSLSEVGCADAGGSGVTETLTITVTPSTTYYIRIIRKNTNNNNMTGQICVSEPSTPPTNDQCSGATVVTCGNTYTGSTALATTTNDPAGTCGTTAGTPGVWYQFVGTGATVTASLCGSSYDTKIQVYSGTCGSLTCVTGNDDYCSLQSQVTFASTSGTTYYIFVGGFASATGNYTLAITCVTPSPPNCANYTSPSNGTTLSCNTTNLTWTAPTGGGTPTQYLLYFGTNNPPTNINNGTNIGNVLTYTPTSLTSNTTYYWQIVPQNGAGSATGCSIYSFTTGNSTIANDICSGAIALTSGVSINDDNSCATDEPSVPVGTCWSTGTVNSLWYSINVTGSTLGVLTTAGTLANTQIAVYSGSCASLTQVGCNDDAPGAGCSAAATSNSQLNLTGLSAGTYYIRVDGRNNNVGTYNIMANTTSSVGTAVPVPGQDCTAAIPLCANPLPVGNPGYQNTGNICDFGSLGNCTSGEKNSLWLNLTVQTGGTLNFTIIPNDYTGCDAETDYDWVIWKTTGTGATNCSQITSTSGDNEVACNFSYLGVTGVAAGGNQPASGISPAPTAGCYDAAFEPTINTTTGDVYTLVIQNYSSSTSGFTITFSGTTVLSTSNPSQVLWTGGANTTTWTTSQNWGSCSAPNCSPGVDGVVAASASSQPIVTGTQDVKNLTINSGATLTLAAGATLNVCGDFTNNGTLTCGAGSTVNFNGTGTQNVSGNLTGTNKFANFKVTKTNGTVSLLNNIEVGENLTTMNATSIINTNGVDITLGGNFSNYTGTTTFTGINSSTSTFTFNGTGTQSYDPTVNAGTNITLNNVVVTNSRAGFGDITLLDDMLIGQSSSTGSLTLTSGDILTNALRVQVNNTTPTSVTTGNTTSFVNGNLRRYLTTTGSYDWPVGNSAKGYQRANTNFSSCTIGYIDAFFTVWPGTPPTQGGTDCSATFNQPAENNGYWTLTANTGTGTYNMTLYPTNATNTAGMGGWTIMKDPTIGSGTWSLNGTCVVSSTASQVMRNGMTGFSVFGAAQSLTPLPIELLTFTGKKQGSKNLLEWSTATEVNNDFFTLERSENGYSFETLTIVDGAGNSTHVINYNSYDNDPYYGVTYYRLKQTDYDGHCKYSNIIALDNRINEASVSNIHPNPTNSNINFNFYSPVKGDVIIEIYDYTGRIVSNETVMVNEGYSTLIAKMENLATGVYTMKIVFENANFRSINKVIKN